MTQQDGREGSSSLLFGVAVLAMAGLLLVALTIGGGSSRVSTTVVPNTSATSEAAGPEALLREMVSRYRQAAAYADDGTLTLSFVQNGRSQEQKWDAQVKFVRPGRIRVQSFQLGVVSDVSADPPRFYARIRDPETGDLDGQVLAVAAPKRISLDDFARDGMLADQLGSRLQRPPVQLELLLNEKPLDSLLKPESKMKFSQLDPQEVDGVKCRGVKVEDDNGAFVFWIDDAQLLLRRLEYPTRQLLPELTADASIAEVKLVCDLHAATFTPQVNELDFTFQPPAPVHYVKQFIPPPRLSDTRLLGKAVPPFELTATDGSRITNESLTGRITALFWYAHHPVCELPAKSFADVAESRKDDERFSFRAVCTEGPEVGDKEVLAKISDWHLPSPVARDLADCRSSVFQLGELPAVVLLDAQGRYQSVLLGADGLAVLPQALERIARGHDLAKEALGKVARIREQYQFWLMSEGGSRPNLEGEPEKIATPSAPRHLVVSPGWQLDSFPQPAGLLARDADTLLAIADEREVWEINREGKVLTRNSLALPDQATIDSLRAFRVQDRWFYAGFNLMTRGVFFFDENWQLLGRYHAEPDDMAAVSDIELAPWGTEGEPVALVGHIDTLGLHAVSLKGEVLWRNRTYLPVTSICLSAPLEARGQIALLAGKETLGQINRYGNEDPERRLAGWSLAELQRASFTGATQAAYAAIGQNGAGEQCLVGFNNEFAEQWNFPLPQLDFTSRMDSLLSARLRAGSAGEWIVALPDGSVHIVSEDGEFTDHFNTGKQLRAFAVLGPAESPLLILSAADGIFARQIAIREK